MTLPDPSAAGRGAPASTASLPGTPPTSSAERGQEYVGPPDAELLCFGCGKALELAASVVKDGMRVHPLCPAPTSDPSDGKFRYVGYRVPRQGDFYLSQAAHDWSERLQPRHLFERVAGEADRG